MQNSRTRGVQAHEIAAAADALVANGEQPTVERVRLQLGRGSPNTIGPMLKTWFAGLGARLGLVGDGQGQPSALPHPLLQAMANVWDLARVEAAAKARDEVEAERAALTAERAALQAELAKAHDDVTAAKAKEAAAADSLMRAQEDRARLQSATEKLETELAGSRASLAAQVERADRDRREFDARVASMEQDRVVQNERHDAVQRRFMQDIDRERQATKAAVVAAAHADAQSQQRIAASEAALKESQNAASAAERDLAATRAALTSTCDRVKDLEKVTDSLTQQVRTMTDQLKFRSQSKARKAIRSTNTKGQA